MCKNCDSKTSFHAVDRTLSRAQIVAAIPPECLDRSTTKSILYVVRDAIFIVAFGLAIAQFEGQLPALRDRYGLGKLTVTSLRWAAWIIYFWFQGLAFTGFWILGHEAGHGSLSPSRTICDILGYIIHTPVGSPYYSWRYSHKQHHDFNGHIDKDEHFIPEARSSPPRPTPKTSSLLKILLDGVEDTPIYQTVSLVVRQLIGFQLYLLFNVSGQARYPWYTSHFNPQSIMYRPDQFWDIVWSDIGIASTMAAVYISAQAYGWATVTRMYVIPWLLMSHWITMIVFLQHWDPVIPHYRRGEWTYVRGALATMDRPFLGWQGKFFLHHISHCHTIHHLNSKIPFYHAPKATEAIKGVLGDHYSWCDTPVFQALWNNYRDCQYVDDTGDILFFKDKKGNAKILSSDVS